MCEDDYRFGVGLVSTGDVAGGCPLFCDLLGYAVFAEFISRNANLVAGWSQDVVPAQCRALSIHYLLPLRSVDFVGVSRPGISALWYGTLLFGYFFWLFFDYHGLSFVFFRLAGIPADCRRPFTWYFPKGGQFRCGYIICCAVYD